MRLWVVNRGRSGISVPLGHPWRLLAAFLADWRCDTTSTFSDRLHNLFFIRAICH
jgi:hypothetical protein